MASPPTKTENLLYLDHIKLQEALNREYTLKLFVENEERELQTRANRTWTPIQRPGVFLTSEMRVELQMKSGHAFWAKYREKSGVIDLQEVFDLYWNSNEHEFTVPKDVDIGKHHCSLVFEFSASTTAESLRSSLRELEGLLEEYSPLLSGSVEKVVEKVVKYGTVFAELNPISKALFGVANVTFELLKEQNKHDQMPLGLLDRLQRILPLADKVADEIVCKETELLEKIIPRMFGVMHRVAKFSCDYVKYARTLGGPAYLETIEKMEKELTETIEDFDRAVNVEALRLAKETGRAEQELLLLRRLKPVDTSYKWNLGCMEGTRESLLNQIMAQVTNAAGEKDEFTTFWVNGLPGIGKTSLAHSICAGLHKGKHLAGAFFCRRDDPNLSEPGNVLPTLIYKLAIVLPPFGSIVAESFRNDPNLTPESMQYSLFLDFISKLPHPPKYTLAFVIDALDECGDEQSRTAILKVLTEAAARAPWLKIIVTSRPEVDIQRFFGVPTCSSHIQYDLAADADATSDIRRFAQDRFSKVASKLYLQSPWPDPLLFNGVISRAAGLFIFIKTVALALEQCKDPTEFLKATLRDSAGPGLTSLYGLYSSILRARIVHSHEEFRRMIGVLLATAPYRALCDETVAELADVDVRYVKTRMDDLSSLLYRDERANGAVRVRHLSISDFFISDGCPCDYQVSLRDANVQLGIACLKAMVDQLRFNICKLEDSRLANAEVQDLETRTKESISDALQYSSRYWSNHLCFTSDDVDRRMLGNLEEFFGGLYPLLWIEVLSITGTVPIGAPSLRRVISWVRDSDSNLRERIQDVCRFIITFHFPISISAPHTYISTAPFLPVQSPLSIIFSTEFTRMITMRSKKMLSWPAPPLEWTGHTASVNCMSYSPNGWHIVTGSLDRTIRIWDVETSAVVGNPLQGHTGSVLSVAYSPDGRHITSGSADKTIRIWNAETGAAVGKPLVGHTENVRSIACSPDGRCIISGSDDMTIRMWDAKTGAVIGQPLVGHTGHVCSVTYSPDGRYIVSGSNDKTIRIWNAKTGATISRPLLCLSSKVGSVVYSPDGRHIASGSSDRTIRIWDAQTGTPVGKPLVGDAASVGSIAYSPDGRHIISGSGDKTIRVWDAGTGAAVVQPLVGHKGVVLSVTYSPDGRHIASGSEDRVIRIWDAGNGAAVGNPAKGDTGMVMAVAFSPDGQHVTSGSYTGVIQTWDAKTGFAISRPLQRHAMAVSSIAYSPNGQHITSGSQDSTIQIWDAQSGTADGKYLQGHTGIVCSVAYSPNGLHIISGSTDKTIRKWDAETGAVVGKPLKGHRMDVNSVAYSPNGQYIVSGSDDGTIRIWDAETGAPVGKPLQGYGSYVISVAYSPDGQHIISGSADTTVRIWDAKTGAAVGMPLVGHTGAILSVAYSPNGQHIISGSTDTTVRIWDTKTGAAVGNPLLGHKDAVWCVAYSPDGQHIVSGSWDKTMMLWDSLQHTSPQLSSRSPIHVNFSARPDQDGWVKDSDGGLLYWVPPDCRTGLHSPARLTIYTSPDIRAVSLEYGDVAYGSDWTQILESTQY